jgi:hypothetical protein
MNPRGPARLALALRARNIAPPLAVFGPPEDSTARKTTQSLERLSRRCRLHVLGEAIHPAPVEAAEAIHTEPAPEQIGQHPAGERPADGFRVPAKLHDDQHVVQKPFDSVHSRRHSLLSKRSRVARPIPSSMRGVRSRLVL